MKTDFDIRMKMYENMESGRRLIPLIPALCRIDGRNFHTFTRNMQRPYDEKLSKAMQDTTKWLVEETGARCGYTQSDEISLLWLENNPKSEIFFGGRIQKMVSQTAALATAFFNNYRESDWPEMASFDSRVWNLPNEYEAANYFLWREQDATRNSISMAAQSKFSHQQLMYANTQEMQEMLFQEGINWNDYPSFFKRGTYFVRRKTTRQFSSQELDKLPHQHEARRNPDLLYERSEVVKLDLPPFGTLVNKIDVLFSGAEGRTMNVS